MRILSYKTIGLIIKEGFLAITLSVILGTVGGAILNSMFEAILAFPALLALAPPLSDMAGDFGLMIGSRLITALKLGYIRPRVLFRTKVLRKNLVAILSVGSIASAYLGVITLLTSYVGGLLTVNPWTLIQIASFSGLLLVVVVTASGILFSVLSFKYGLDFSPLITSIGDLSGPACLIIVARLLQLV